MPPDRIGTIPGVGFISPYIGDFRLVVFTVHVLGALGWGIFYDMCHHLLSLFFIGARTSRISPKLATVYLRIKG
jgi:hypothetical protein